MIETLAGIEPGDIFTNGNREVWEVVSFCHKPTLTLRNLRTGEQIGGAVGCPNLGEFVPLIPAQPLQERRRA